MGSDRLRYRTRLYDSARWNDFAFRPDDIVICTPPKCGTTWMQMICALLIFQNPNLDRPLSEISPWLDMLIQTKAEVFARLKAQSHRRFIKTHTPLDGLPIHDSVTYICVGRDPRDAAISMIHHRENANREAFQAAVERVVRMDDMDDPIWNAPPSPPESLEAGFWHWVEDATPYTQSGSSLLFTLHHFDEALRARDRANVVVMHYGDLKADLEGEMRRLAARLTIEIAEPNWPRLVEAASFERMRARATELAPDAQQQIWKEPQQFFHSGMGGSWREFFDDVAQHRYEARASALTTPEVATWAHSGWKQFADVEVNDRRVAVLNQLKQAINSTYGFRDGAPRINLGPCGRFARDFRERWNARFRDKITIVFVMTRDGTTCHHVMVRLPDGSYYDGGNGVITAQTLQKLYPDSCLDEMTEFDPMRLDKWSYGLGRSYPACPNYSDETTNRLIDRHLADLPMTNVP